MYVGGVDASLNAATDQEGCELKYLKPIAEGNNKSVYRLTTGEVLKVSPLGAILDQIKEGIDDVTYSEITAREFGQDAEKMIAFSRFAGEGVPATIQEAIVPTDLLIKQLEKSGMSDLAQRVQEAHKANPLSKYYQYEQKTRNSGAKLVGDKLYIVAQDYTEGYEINEVVGGWDTLRSAVSGIQPLDLAEFVGVGLVEDYIKLLGHDSISEYLSNLPKNDSNLLQRERDVD